jgi:lipid A 4'-phosphatase
MPYKFITHKFVPIAIATIVIIFITLATRMWHLDMLISDYFYTPEEGFLLRDSLLVIFFYDSIGWAVKLGIMCFIAYPIIYWRIKVSRKYCRTVLALFLTLSIGPGIIVNSIFKDHFGRPRPVQTIEFGGKYEHKEILESNWGNPGKSFPSGHASVPLAFLILVFSAYRRGKTTTATVLATVIAAWYIGVSYARVAAGGHHFSDVTWAGYVTFICAWLSYLYIEQPSKQNIK